MNTVDQQNELFAKVVKKTRFVMLSTLDENGKIKSRPMTLQEQSESNLFYIFTSLSSDTVEQIKAKNDVNIEIVNLDDMAFFSVEGEAHVSHDRDLIEKLWSPAMKVWFKGGVTDPDLCLLKIDIKAVDYWDSPASKLVRLAGFAKAIITGETNNAAIGEHGRIKIN